MRLKTLIPKSEARKLVVQRRAEISSTEIKNKTKRIINKFIQTDEYVYGSVIHCYVNSRPGEVDTRSLIDLMTSSGKSVIVPKLNKKTKTFARFHFMGWDSLVKNSEGYWEPKLGVDEDLSDVDLIIVPSLAVSIAGHRVGYGGGYYDRLLRNSFAPKIVLAFEFQLFDYIENSTHDIRVDKIITERRIIDPRSPSK